MPFGIEHVLLRLVEERLEADRQVHDLVGRRLVDRAVDVVAGVDAGDEAARRQLDLGAGDRIEDRDPRVVERGVGRIDAAPASRAHPRRSGRRRSRARRCGSACCVAWPISRFRMVLASSR